MNEQERCLNILWVARALPLPLDAGDKVYTAGLAGALASAGNRVHFLGLAPDGNLTPQLTSLSGDVDWEIIPGAPRSMASGLFSHLPMVAARFGTAAFKRRLRTLLESKTWDAIVLDQYGTTWALPTITDHRKSASSSVIVHVAHDFETDVTHDIAKAYRGNAARKAALRLNAKKTAAAEKALAKAADLVVTLTKADQAEFHGIGAKGEFAIIPPGYGGKMRQARDVTRDTPRRVAIVGSYRWTAKQMNLSAFLAVADPIFAQAGIELSIVGDAPSDFVAVWAPKLKATKFEYFVDDLEAHLSQCRMGLVVEDIGGGFKLKVLDYVFTRTPVAALAQGLTGQSELVTRNFLIANDPAQLANLIAKTIDNISALNVMQNGAYDAALNAHSWSMKGALFQQKIRAISQVKAERIMSHS